jgi:DNA-binding NarL/FixJ family response regulator
MRGIRVLVADDQPAVRVALSEALNEYDGIAVVGAAADAVQALHLVRNLEPDVVLMDIRMPGVDGIAATRAVIDARPRIRVFMLTAYDDASLVNEAMEAGAAGYLVKGTALSDIVEALRADAMRSSLTASWRPS